VCAIKKILVPFEKVEVFCEEKSLDTFFCDGVVLKRLVKLIITSK